MSQGMSEWRRDLALFFLLNCVISNIHVISECSYQGYTYSVYCTSPLLSLQRYWHAVDVSVWAPLLGSLSPRLGVYKSSSQWSGNVSCQISFEASFTWPSCRSGSTWYLVVRETCLVKMHYWYILIRFDLFFRWLFLLSLLKIGLFSGTRSVTRLKVIVRSKIKVLPDVFRAPQWVNGPVPSAPALYPYSAICASISIFIVSIYLGLTTRLDIRPLLSSESIGQTLSYSLVK